MRKILFLVLIFVISAAWAQDSQEEAIILNQEMDFLRSDAAMTEVYLPRSTKTAQNAALTDEAADKQVDLDEFFFGDKIETKAAAPKRRIMTRGN